jgi:hypothetical protein
MANKPVLDTSKKAVDSVVTYWLNEIAAAKKREKNYRKDGERILKIYSGAEPDKTPYNILYSNTETLLPALYSSIPRPVVQRRFKDEDEIGKASSLAGQRVLEFLVDTNIDGYETFDEGVRTAVLDGLLPGRGITCVKYDAEIDEMAPDEPAEGEPPGEPTPYKKSELVCLETKSWNKVYFGYAKRWAKVPWIAYEDYIDKEEAIRLFGEEIAAQMIFTRNEDDDEDKKSQSQDNDMGERKTSCIYQIWDKEHKKVRYISTSYQESQLKEIDDPLGLTGFFNCPKPMMFMEKTNDLVPTALYVLYENQAKELNRLTTRISHIVEAIKAKAIYDSELGVDIQNLVEADDNAFVPADKSSSLAAEKGLQNAIWFMPVEQLVNVLIQLYSARMQCEQVIYKINGIADIMRGSSNASETLGAQEIKQTWGTLRLKRFQAEVQRYARDLLRMMLEIAATKFSEDTWAQMTGLPFLTEEQFTQLQNQMMAMQQQMALMPPQPGPDGQPLPNPLEQQMQQLQGQLQSPQWKDVLGLLKNDMQRAYRVDIETNSTVQPEATEDQKNIADVMNALAQYLNGVAPLVTAGTLPFEAAQGMMMAIVRRFRFGPEIEEYIKGMKAPPPPDDGKGAEKEKAQVEMAILQAEGQQKEKEGQFKIQEMAAKAKVSQQQAQLDERRLVLEAEIAEKEHQMKMEELAGKAAYQELMGRLKTKQAEQKLAEISAAKVTDE